MAARDSLAAAAAAAVVPETLNSIHSSDPLSLGKSGSSEREKQHLVRYDSKCHVDVRCWLAFV